MAETKRVAVVTGANKGIGFDVVRQLASQGITVVVTERDEKRGLEALHKLKESGGLPGKVNNAAIGGLDIDEDGFRALVAAIGGYIPSEWAKGILSDVDDLTEEKLDEVLNAYLKDVEEGSLEAKGWPLFFGAYTISKAAVNAYTRIVAKKQPAMKVNCVCPGYVKTDLNFHTGTSTVDEGAGKIVRLVLLPDDGPSGLFFRNGEVSDF